MRGRGQAHLPSYGMGIKPVFQATQLVPRQPSLRSREHRDERERVRGRERDAGQWTCFSKDEETKRGVRCSRCDVQQQESQGEAHHPRAGESRLRWPQRLVLSLVRRELLMPPCLSRLLPGLGWASTSLGFLSGTGVCHKEFATICCSSSSTHRGRQTGDICSV